MVRANAPTNKIKVYRRRSCLFCKEKSEPDFKETEALKKFITERGKIVGRAKTGVCAGHQRKLASSIKRARILSLLPFVPRI
ncbi:MAG: 30S ribosomal protein S18 [Candidatus Woykebacteria bacterium GWB1_45_5]|uniref:Small ribosomal subunit protein bS18 n=2 Tax=Candidatus Woykeibacteriota TaxID=1817899 RepID=A0A1G1W362_9BACT|nr:MAG: 30S ribosomal protein S18 [Candidatus Woykebacteria bacterium GWA1_44_8]OGY23937.1 MAG: 30S ribosomal protein S18 [Candidatus Woykebacteria bacterium GWB1_45_5]